ncbi:MAG: hypothetical protein LBK60_03370 [Verrucomicrobiales bacterium]|nr:hypothetical protein [Verrucomicrobiales bacterium]
MADHLKEEDDRMFKGVAAGTAMVKGGGGGGPMSDTEAMSLAKMMDRNQNAGSGYPTYNFSKMSATPAPTKMSSVDAANMNTSLGGGLGGLGGLGNTGFRMTA